MRILHVNNNKRLLLGAADACPICDTPRTEMIFTWNLRHGEATSNCCGAIYQIKDYYIDDPSEEQQELLKCLKGEFIEFCIKEEWISPIRQSLKETGKKTIDDEVLEKADAMLKAREET